VHRGSRREARSRAHDSDADLVKVAIDAWTAAAGIVDGHVLRPVDRGGPVRGERLSEKVVWQLLQQYAAAAGVPGIAPHDLSLRSYGESGTMPNRYKGSSFGGELGDQSDQLIRHSQEGSAEGIRGPLKGQQVIIGR